MRGTTSCKGSYNKNEKKGNKTMQALSNSILGALDLAGKHWLSEHALYVDQLFSDSFSGQGLAELKGELAKASESEPYEPDAVAILSWFVDVMGLLQMLSGSEASRSRWLGLGSGLCRPADPSR